MGDAGRFWCLHSKITFIKNMMDCDVKKTLPGRTEGHTFKGSFILEVLFCEGFKPDTGHPGLVGSHPSQAPSGPSDLGNLKEEVLYQASCQTSSVLLFSVLILYGSRCFSESTSLQR